MLNAELLYRLRDICKKITGYRTHSEIQFLIELTQNIKLFKDLHAKQGEHSHAACCQYLLYEHIEPNQYIFHCGDTGTKFYIIVSGEVSIEIPMNDGNRIIYNEVMTYIAGSSFGELALESEKPRSASAKAKSHCHLLVLIKKDYNRLMQRFVTEKKIEMTNFLKSLPIFESINKYIIAKLLYCIREINFTKGQVLFKEGDAANEIYFINHGECKLCKLITKARDCVSLNRTSRKELHTAKRLGKGSMIGEEDVLNKTRRSYRCICSSDTLLIYAIPSIDFFSRINADQPIKYLTDVSTAKKNFLSEWSDFRVSLETVFLGKKTYHNRSISDKLNTLKLKLALNERQQSNFRNESSKILEKVVVSTTRQDTVGQRSRKRLGDELIRSLHTKNSNRTPLQSHSSANLRTVTRHERTRTHY